MNIISLAKDLKGHIECEPNDQSLTDKFQRGLFVSCENKVVQFVVFVCFVSVDVAVGLMDDQRVKSIQNLNQRQPLLLPWSN